MDTPRQTGIWVAYFLGFGLTLLFKWGKAVYLGKKEGKTVKQVSLEWFFEPTLDNGSSWIATIGGVWVVGSIYINQIIDITGIPNLPVDAGLSFFLGSIFEMLVPNLTKWLVKIIPVGK